MDGPLVLLNFGSPLNRSIGNAHGSQIAKATLKNKYYKESINILFFVYQKFLLDSSKSIT